MPIAKLKTEIHIKIGEFLRDLFPKSSITFVDLNNLLMSRPITIQIIHTLFEI